MSRETVVIVLASGRGARFVASGGTVPKLQALLAGRPVLDWTLAAVRASGLRYHLEDAGHPGMGDSIAAGVRATADAQAWLILPGDLPLIEPSTLCSLATAHPERDVVFPVVQGQRGHPVRFSAACGPALLRLSGAQGAAALARARNAAAWPLQDAGCILDIDTLDDLRQAERLLALRGSGAPAH